MLLLYDPGQRTGEGKPEARWMPEDPHASLSRRSERNRRGSGDARDRSSGPGMHVMPRDRPVLSSDLPWRIPDVDLDTFYT